MTTLVISLMVPYSGNSGTCFVLYLPLIRTLVIAARLNGGSCQAGFTSKGFRCICPEEFSGGEVCQGIVKVMIWSKVAT